MDKREGEFEMSDKFRRSTPATFISSLQWSIVETLVECRDNWYYSSTRRQGARCVCEPARKDTKLQN
jgi:hypothetical protein